MEGRGGGADATEHTTKGKNIRRKKNFIDSCELKQKQYLQKCVFEYVYVYISLLVLLFPVNVVMHFSFFVSKYFFSPFTCLVERQEQVQELMQLQWLEEVWGSERQEERSR